MKPLAALGPAALPAAALGALGAGLVDLAPGRAGVLAASVLLALVVFTLWPWSVLPVGLVGATAVIPLLGGGGLTFIVAVHAGVLALGGLALLVRRAVSAFGDEPVRTPVDLPMLGFALIGVLAGGYGLACGNARHAVLIAAYEFGVIPAYYFAATHTLNSAERLRSAGILYVFGAAVLAVSGIAAPGRHGGLLSVLAVPPLLIAAGRLRGWSRAGVVLLTAGFTLDVVLAAYRAMWLAAGLALLILFLRAMGPIRSTLVAAVATGAVLTVGAVTFSAGAHARSALVGQQLHQSAGYRESEAAVGLRVFARSPLFGDGLGQAVPHVYLPGFVTTTVGPAYHVFSVMILANLGLLGLAAMLWPILRTLRGGLATRDGYALAFACLTCGFLAASTFAGPTDGHWELGLLPALTLLSARPDLKPATAHRSERLR